MTNQVFYEQCVAEALAAAQEPPEDRGKPSVADQLQHLRDMERLAGMALGCDEGAGQQDNTLFIQEEDGSYTPLTDITERQLDNIIDLSNYVKQR